MTQAHVIQATLLYDTMPPLPDEKLRTELRALAGHHNLSTAGETDFREGVLRLVAEPYEITIEPVEAALPAASFSGALSAHINRNLRRPLASVVAEHTAHLRIAVRDMIEAKGSEPSTGQRLDATLFAQDVLRLIMHLLPPMALHWHPSNMLSLPMGLGSSKPGTLFLPLCLRMRNTSSTFDDGPQINFAQSIEGAEALLGRPLHVMATSLDRYETLDLAIAFIGQVIQSDGGPVAGTVFRDHKGTRVEVVDHKPCDSAPGGLLALVELEQDAIVTPMEAPSREKVAARANVSRANRSRDPGAPSRPKVQATLSAAQAEILRRSVSRIDADRAVASEPQLPDRLELQALRRRTASQPRNTPGQR